MTVIQFKETTFDDNVFYRVADMLRQQIDKEILYNLRKMRK
jgi:hypothetical protein